MKTLTFEEPPETLRLGLFQTARGGGAHAHQRHGTSPRLLEDEGVFNVARAEIASATELCL